MARFDSALQTVSGDVSFTKLYDYDGSGNLLYEGWSQSGASTAAAVWTVKKYTYDGSSNLVSESWADGNAKGDNIWDNRVSLSYS